MNAPTVLFRCLTLLAIVASLHAQTWTEADAGSLPISAETTVGDGPLQRIDGALSSSADVDLYLIRIDDPASFECSTVGGATWNTQLWMFHRDGRGIAFRDDQLPHLQSTLTGQFLGAAGHVLIGISAYDNDPIDGLIQYLWLDAPENSERQPDGPGATEAVANWFMPLSTASGTYSLFLRGASFARKVTASRPDVAWAHVSPPYWSSSFVPDANFQHTPSGELVTVQRLAQGRFRVDFPNLGAVFDGVPHASASLGNHSVVVRSWAPAGTVLQVFVDVFTAGGALVDGDFMVHFRRGGEPTMRSAYLWANDSTATNYMPLQTYNWNGNRGFATVQRITTGLYRVTVPSLASVSSELGNVQVSPVNGYSGPAVLRHAAVVWVHGANDIVCDVSTFDQFGNPVDAMFVLSYHEFAAPIAGDQGSGAHVTAHVWNATYPPDSRYADSNGTAGPLGAEMISRLGTGDFSVLLPSVVDSDSATVQACLVGGIPGHVSILGVASAPTRVLVRTFDAFGNPADRQFSLSYLTDRPARNAATNAVVDGGCHGIALRARNRPLLGTNWTFDLTGVQASSALGLMMVGLQNPDLPLGFLGAPECVLLQDALSLTVLPLPIGTPAYGLTLPTSPTFLGVPVYVQGGAFTSGVNALGLAASNAIRGMLGDN